MFIHPRVKYTNPQEDRSNSFVKYFANRVMNYNKNFLCAVTGQTGSGKSWLTGSIGETYRKMTGMPFNPEIHTFFTLKQLLDLVNDKDRSDKLEPCTFLHFDEPQVSVNSRTWQSESNNILNTLTSTFRNRRLVVFFATPYLEFLDKQTRILFHSEIRVKSFDKTRNITVCEPRILEYVAKFQEFYKKRLIIQYPDEKRSVSSWYYLQTWEVKKPSKEWVDVYEPMKKRFTDELNKELAEKINNTGEKKKVAINSGEGEVYKKIREIYVTEGENYDKFLELFPHLSPNTIRGYVTMIKKTNKFIISNDNPLIA